MTNLQLYLAIGVPSFLVLLNMLQTYLLRAEISNLRSEMATELRAIRSDINTLTRMYGEHEGRIATLEERTGGKAKA